MFMSFRLKTILGIASIELVLLSMLIWSSLEFLKTSNEEELIKRAATTATLFATTTQDAVLTTDVASLESFVKEVLKNPGLVYARVIGTTDGVLAQGGDPQALARPFVSDHSDLKISDGVFDTSAAIAVGGVVYGRVEIGLSSSPIQEVLADARKKTSILAALEMALTALFSFALGTYLTRQVKGLTDGSRRLAQGELGYQIEVRGRDELAQSTQAFNDMSRKLLASHNARQRAEQELTKITEDLEDRVKLRTRQLAELNKKLEHQTLHDPLTKLPNRMLFHDRLQQAVVARERESHSLAVMIIDLDNFKAINDTMGHHAGDIVLQQVSSRMQEALRESATLARLGGDEFVILLPSISGRVEAMESARRSLAAIKMPLLISDKTVEVSASIGVAVLPDDGIDANTLMRHADMAMYAAKRSKMGVAEYSVDLEVPRRDRLALQSELRQAIAQNELLLHYQPKIDFRTGNINGVEAFVRWLHPKNGLMLPDDFIPLAEETGLIKPLTLCVLTQALQQYGEWRRNGIELPVAVRISSANLQDPEFPARIAQIMADCAAPPSSLEIGVTELTILVDPLRAIESFTKLREMGVKIAIADFGATQSLSYLKKMLIEKIKIDRSFIINMVNNENDSAIVRHTINLAHSLGLKVVAEGVEDESTWDELRTLGCDFAQGHYLGRPMPATEIKDWLDDSGRCWPATTAIIQEKAV
jgi:diguanylate cyclase (GGDEF)-like protein